MLEFSKLWGGMILTSALDLEDFGPCLVVMFCYLLECEAVLTHLDCGEYMSKDMEDKRLFFVAVCFPLLLLFLLLLAFAPGGFCCCCCCYLFRLLFLACIGFSCFVLDPFAAFAALHLRNHAHVLFIIIIIIIIIMF